MLFLESETETSVENCSNVPLFTPDLYNYEFLTQAYSEIVSDTSYNITILDQLELVVVVVDCSFTPLTEGDRSSARVFNLVRSRNDPYDLYVVVVSLSVQDYEVHAHSEFGPALLGMLSVVHDLRENNPEQYYMVAETYPYQRSLEFGLYEFVGLSGGYLKLRSIPEDPLTEPVEEALLTRKRGFYNGDIQSNMNFMYTLLDAKDAKTALTTWEWFGKARIFDSWGGYMAFTSFTHCR